MRGISGEYGAFVIHGHRDTLHERATRGNANVASSKRPNEANLFLVSEDRERIPAEGVKDSARPVPRPMKVVAARKAN